MVNLLWGLGFANAILLVRGLAAQYWSGWGGSTFNNRWARNNTDISSSTISKLTEHCSISHPIGVSATPVIHDNIAYYPTWDGTFAAVNYEICRTLWEVNVTEIVEGHAPASPSQAKYTRAVSRTSPQIDGDVLFFGTLMHALVVALNRTTGETLDTIQINSHQFAVVTQSPTFFDGKLLIGASSSEHLAAQDPSYDCCSFIGNFVGLSFSPTDGFKLEWNADNIPTWRTRDGWSGAPVWGSQPSIDAQRNRVYIGTGNSYSIPQLVAECLEAYNVSSLDRSKPDPCLTSDVWQDSVVAIDIDSGVVMWAYQSPRIDAFSATCGFPGFPPADPALCPELEAAGLDQDFGMAPTFVPGSHLGDIVVAARKDGFVYALSASDGRVLWSTSAGPPGGAGGISWGVAVDDSSLYYAAINSDNVEWRLSGSNKTTSRSAYGAISLADGAIKWQTPVPREGVCYAPPSVVGDLVLVARTGEDPKGDSSYDQTQGSLVVLDKSTGQVLSEIVLSSNTHSGIAIQDEFVLLGTGYDGFSTQATLPGGFHVFKIESKK